MNRGVEKEDGVNETRYSQLLRIALSPLTWTLICECKVPHDSLDIAIDITKVVAVVNDQSSFPVRVVCLSNLRILQKSSLSASESGEQWQEKALCLGSAGSCGSMLVGHILGFGEDEQG